MSKIEAIPTSKYAKKNLFAKQPWYHPAFSEQQVQEYLDDAPAGAFVIRNPPHPDPRGNPHKNDLCLSVQAGETQLGPKHVCNVLLKASSQPDGKVYWTPRLDGLTLFEDVTDLVKYCNTTGLNFPKLGSAEIKLNLASAKIAEKQHKKVLKRRASESKIQAKQDEIERKRAEKEFNSKEAVAARQQAQYEADMQEALEKEQALHKEQMAAENFEGREKGRGADMGVELTAEERKELKKAERNSAYESNLNDGDVDPERDIGDIGSQYKAEKNVPEWAKKKMKSVKDKRESMISN